MKFLLIGLVGIFFASCAGAGERNSGGFFTTYPCDTLLVITVGQEVLFSRVDRYIISTSTHYPDKTVYKKCDGSFVVTYPTYQRDSIIPTR